MHAEPPSHHCAHKGSCRWPCQWSVFLQSIIKYGVTIVVKQTMRQISSLLTKDYMRPECNNFTLFNESYVNIRLYSLQFASPCCVQMTSMLSEIQLTEFQTQNWWRERVRERKKERKKVFHLCWCDQSDFQSILWDLNVAFLHRSVLPMPKSTFTP